METEIVSLKNVNVYYEKFTVLEEINLSVKQQDFLGIIGPNGGGKTSLLRVILGLVKPHKGKVTVFGTLPQKSRQAVGYVPQINLFDREFPISVWETVLMGRLGYTKILHSYDRTDKELAAQALQTVDMLDYKNQQIGTLSEGQKQRVFIARALTTNPKLLLLDEPTSSIDMHAKSGLYEILKKLKEKMAIILITHDIGIVSSYVNKIACLNRKLFYHDSNEIHAEDLEAVYHCPVELLMHGEVPHRVIKKHK